MNEQIKTWLQEIEEYKEAIKKRELIIETFRDLCNHEFEYTGRGSHKEYYKCVICGKEEKV